MGKLLRTVGYYWRYLTGQAANKISDPVRDSKFQIEDAEAQCRKFETQIAKLMSANNANKRKLEEQQAEVKKWKTCAERAAASGNEVDTRTALSAQISAEKKVKETKADLEQSRKEAEQLKQQLDTYRQKIESAKDNNARFAARLEGAQIRQALSGTRNDLENAFSFLGDLEKQANEAVDLADAMTELKGSSSDNLADKYLDQDENFENRLQKLMGK